MIIYENTDPILYMTLKKNADPIGQNLMNIKHSKIKCKPREKSRTFNPPPPLLVAGPVNKELFLASHTPRKKYRCESICGVLLRLDTDPKLC